jgi:hypothetical protein
MNQHGSIREETGRGCILLWRNVKDDDEPGRASSYVQTPSLRSDAVVASLDNSTILAFELRE